MTLTSHHQLRKSVNQYS